MGLGVGVISQLDSVVRPLVVGKHVLRHPARPPSQICDEVLQQPRHEAPFHVSRLERVVEGEERWQTMGLIGAVVVVLVAHTYKEVADEVVIRIISAKSNVA